MTKPANVYRYNKDEARGGTWSTIGPVLAVPDTGAIDTHTLTELLAVWVDDHADRPGWYWAEWSDGSEGRIPSMEVERA
jgi:hypothetical protein